MEDDLVSRLFDRGLIHIVEDILLFTSARTVAACLRVCRCWHAHLTEHNVWRLLYVKMFRRRRQFRRLCCHNGWLDHVPGQGAKTTDLAIYRRILYKSTCFREIWCEECLLSTKLYTGYLISCLKVFRSLLFAGMQDGQIKVWVIRDPVRNTKAFRVLEGHEERVTSMDAVEDSLVSASVDHSIRIWSIKTGGMIRVLRGPCAPILQVKLTQNRLISLADSGRVNFWSWQGPLSIELTHHTTLEPGDLEASASVILDNDYIAVARQNSDLLAIYSSQTGRRLWDKEIFCTGSNIQSFALHRSLACLGTGASAEVWSLVDHGSLLASLEVGSLTTCPSYYMKELAMSDCLVVGMLSTGQTHFWSLAAVLHSGPAAIILPVLSIDNREPSWKGMALNDTKLVFSLEIKFGDVKVYSFSHESNQVTDTSDQLPGRSDSNMLGWDEEDEPCPDLK